MEHEFGGMIRATTHRFLLLLSAQEFGARSLLRSARPAMHTLSILKGFVIRLNDSSPCRCVNHPSSCHHGGLGRRGVDQEEMRDDDE